MKHFLHFICFFAFFGFSQEHIDATVIDSTEITLDHLIAIDNFGITYFAHQNVFYKKTPENKLSYNNLQLGPLYSADAFNPLKINLFYKDFNTVIILDNRMAEIFKIDFNSVSPYKNVSHVSTGFDNSIWIFNQDLQKLELFDYKNNSTRAQTAPVQSPVLDLKSNYNYCWLLTQNYLYVYNYFGSLVHKTKNTGFTSIDVSGENLVFKQNNSLFFLKADSITPQEIKIPHLSIKGFSLTNETLYIYDSETLYKLQLKIL
ncbi:hypothetical protein [Tamlana crocina]|uniref:Glutamine cyclotransferase n=1 Tax=Tamlana crocina TaxID=393006 RepID=A0ABX1DAP9_9FLAO|nr:hypothetical protein [Tamlana crocina]NJX14271.1 hypothetical protein [Tamlana crocina]